MVEEFSISVDDINNTKDKELEKEVARKMADIEGIHEYIRQCLATDIKLYFTASTDNDRNKIRGAYERMNRLRMLISKSVDTR